MVKQAKPLERKEYQIKEKETPDYKEYLITSSTKNYLDKDIQYHKKDYPMYDVFNISIAARGGLVLGTTTCYIVWKLKEEVIEWEMSEVGACSGVFTPKNFFVFIYITIQSYPLVLDINRDLRVLKYNWIVLFKDIN